VGHIAVYESLSLHLERNDVGLVNDVVQLDLLVREAELLNLLTVRAIPIHDMEERRNTNVANIMTVMNRLPEMTALMNINFSCGYGTLYEVVTCNLKNRLVSLQTTRARACKARRNDIINRIEYMSATFGDNSIQATDEREKLLRFDDVDLKNRAEKFKEFLDWNNEKATKAFCRLGREGGLCDDISQIKNNEGNAFNSGNERGEYIRTYYEGLYKKKLDRLIAIEDFLTRECMGEEWVQKRRRMTSAIHWKWG
jgi:hypothetical protein